MRPKWRYFSLVIAMTLTFSSAANAVIVWDWSDGELGTEVGTFTTDGNLVNGMAPAGTYVITNFDVTATSGSSSLGSMSDGVYTANPENDIAFRWDGTVPTEFSRGNGALTNGFNIYQNNSTNRFIFDVNYFQNGPDNNSEIMQATTINLMPDPTYRPEPEAVPVMSAYSLVILGCLICFTGLGWSKRKKA